MKSCQIHTSWKSGKDSKVSQSIRAGQFPAVYEPRTIWIGSLEQKRRSGNSILPLARNVWHTWGRRTSVATNSNFCKRYQTETPKNHTKTAKRSTQFSAQCVTGCADYALQRQCESQQSHSSEYWQPHCSPARLCISKTIF